MNNTTLLQTIENEIYSLSKNISQEETIKHHLSYVEELAFKNIPTLLIEKILNDSELLVTIAARSYEHVNYFDKIVLIDNKDPQSFRLTLHSWNCNYGKEIPDEELIHNHRFSFWSHIFRGVLLSENFIESSVMSVEKKTFNRYIYSPSNTGNIHTCEFDKKAQLTKIDTTCYTQGETYYLNYNTTHRVILPKGNMNLCTFVLRGPREREYTNTYNTFYPDNGIASSVPMMTPDQLKSKLIAILGENK